MKKLTGALVLVASLALACGGPPGSTSVPTPGATTGGGSGGAGQLDCATLRSAAQKLVGIQILAQLSTPENVETIRKNLNLDTMLAALGVLRGLEGVSSPLGDPIAAIEVYERAAEDAKVLFAMDPITQEAIDAFNAEHVKTVGEFLGHQVAISAALGENGC